MKVFAFVYKRVCPHLINIIGRGQEHGYFEVLFLFSPASQDTQEIEEKVDEVEIE